MQQPAAPSIGLGAQIEIEFGVVRRDLQAKRLLLGRQVTLQRDTRGTIGNFAEPVTDDELLLDASRLVEEDAPVAAPGALPGRRRGLVSGESGEGGETHGADAAAGEGGGAEEAPRRAPKIASGGATLFERMANLSRGGRSSADEDDEDEDEGGGPSISIPRFLGRQNNQ